MRIPISTKLIVLTVLILLSATVLIALRTSQIFAVTSMQREEYSNQAFAASRATEVENILSSLVDKSKTSASILYKSATNPTATSSDDFELNFTKDKRFVSMEILKLNGTTVELVSRRVKEDFLKTQYTLGPEYIARVRDQQKFPIRSVAQGSVEIRNASYAKGPAMFTIGLPLVKDQQGRISHVALIDIDLSVLQKPFGERSERTFFLVDRQGELIAHQDEQKAMARLSMTASPIVAKALGEQTPRRQMKFKDSDSGAEMIGAYNKTSFGVTVISQLPQELILEPAQDAKREAFYLTGLVLSGSLFVIFVFSMTLTSPIEKLASLIEMVSKGNFDVKATKHVKSHDEVGDLAKAFDHMTEGLKERDKVKNLFSKFHGSSVAEDLINKDIGVGGQSKEVVVFFSDIRGFTAFSEKRKPEEVVAMLNEYFAVMVGIINRHGGVVDKFIGDAIMAIWGAPRSSDKDSHNALRACIEMRKGLAELNEKRMARGEPALMIGMGLHAGTAISGTIGSDERMEYTVIGNTVNTASRIEASTKAFGADLLVTDDVIAHVGDAFILDYAGAAEVKGRSDAIKMYKVRGYMENGQPVEIRTPYSDYEAEGADKVKIKDAA
ncbi:adenylate/guanylate cyclase domain-containing protein [Bdellovibrio sp. HCB337]|uniref:adenylate/guanylate cyclase domain-containing protein n=1 Tax=Bdellovibrio sp. HCB337 TaxID=3394358 RepID=UPI0039A5C815